MKLRFFLISTILGLSSCATVPPSFDIPSNEAGPTVKSITREIECELDDIIANTKNFDNFIINAHDVRFSVLLNLSVTDDGALAPSFTYIAGIFQFGGGASFEQSRAQTFQHELSYSLSERKALANIGSPHLCGSLPDTNLSGNLGIKAEWNLALADITNTDWKSAAANGGPFGGSVTFTVTKKLLATGPTWTLSHFTGPGAFLTASETNVDSITFAFVQGSKANKASLIQAAHDFIQSIRNGDISNSLTTIANRH